MTTNHEYNVSNISNNTRIQREQDSNNSRIQREQQWNISKTDREQQWNISKMNQQDTNRIATDQYRDKVFLNYIKDIGNLLERKQGFTNKEVVNTYTCSCQNT